MKITALLFLILLSLGGYGQSVIEDFSLPDTRGQQVSLSQFSSSRGIAVLFTSQDCIYDQYYGERITNLATQYAGKIQFVLINANQEAGETVEKMSSRNPSPLLPYLADKNQMAMEKLGARRTPEVVLLKPVGSKFQIVFQGAIDDNAQVANDARQFYLRNAIDQLLAGQAIQAPVVRSVGCTIRKK